MRIICQQMIHMKYLALFGFLKRGPNLEMLSAAIVGGTLRVMM